VYVKKAGGRTDVRVFVACPSDLSAERERCQIVTSELNRILRDDAIQIHMMQWEAEVAPFMGRPEEVILEQMRLQDSDIFVGLLWTRFGSPTGGVNALSGEPAMSGTEEEFALAYRLWKDRGYPNILFYRCTRSPDNVMLIDAQQYVRVAEFFSGFAYDGRHPGLVRHYTDVNEFERHFREDLLQAIRSMTGLVGWNPGRLTEQRRLASGLRQLFTPDDNDERNAAKILALRRSSDIRLVAHSGHSYLASVGHRFGRHLIERLDAGATFRSVLTNPWTPTGAAMARGELPGAAASDPVELIRMTTWYSIKFADSLRGLQTLSARFGDRLSVRFYEPAMTATCLLTEDEGYFEPYLDVNLQERLQAAMLTFEIRFDTTFHLYRHLNAYFDAVWADSVDYKTFVENEEQYQESLRLHARFGGSR
jgi:hypothetical protein